MIKIFGVQRTGTNYLSALISKNLGITPLNNDFGWKHGDVVWPAQYLINAKNRMSPERHEMLQAMVNKKLLVGIFIIKNPFTWVKSIHKYAQKTWPHTMSVEEYFAFYNARYKGYIEFWNTTTMRWRYRRFFYVNYENLLSNLYTEINRIRMFCGFETGGVVDIERVPQSERFTEEMRNYYLNPVYDEEVAKHVDWKVANMYGYYENNGDVLYEEEL